MSGELRPYCPAHPDEPTPDPTYDYSVALQERLKDHFLDDEVLGPDVHFRYEWYYGTERFYRHRHGEGSMEQVGATYHPHEGMCEPRPGEPFDETGLCCWCGRVVW